MARLTKNLDDSKPWEVGCKDRTRMRILMMMDDGELVSQWIELGGGCWSLRGEYDAKIRRLGWLARLAENLYDSKPLEVGHEDQTRMRIFTMMDDDGLVGRQQ